MSYCQGCAERDRRIAELERELREWQVEVRCVSGDSVRPSDLLRDLNAKLAAAEAENARLRADAERLDWLERDDWLFRQNLQVTRERIDAARAKERA